MTDIFVNLQDGDIINIDVTVYLNVSVFVFSQHNLNEMKWTNQLFT